MTEPNVQTMPYELGRRRANRDPECGDHGRGPAKATALKGSDRCWLHRLVAYSVYKRRSSTDAHLDSATIARPALLRREPLAKNVIELRDYDRAGGPTSISAERWRLWW